jgi:hypothetical protein
MRGAGAEFPQGVGFAPCAKAEGMFAPALAAATLLALSALAPWNLRVSTMRDRLIAESPEIRTLGVDPRDFLFRLEYLWGRLSAAERSSTEPAVRADLEAQTLLELKLDAELLVNLCPVFAAVDGIDESFYNADPHEAPDPVAFYVPKPNRNGRYALVVLLHDRRQTETDVISHGLLRELADRDHALLVAPWGSGATLWGAPAASEVDAIVTDLERSFPIDERRVYLAGIGLGGGSVFRVARTGAFRAVLSVGGALPAGDAFAAVTAFRSRDVYLVGEPDSYDALASQCVPVSDYAVNGRPNDLYAAAPQIEQAWSDMFGGVVRNTNDRECTAL